MLQNTSNKWWNKSNEFLRPLSTDLRRHQFWKEKKRKEKTRLLSSKVFIRCLAEEGAKM